MYESKREDTADVPNGVSHSRHASVIAIVDLTDRRYATADCRVLEMKTRSAGTLHTCLRSGTSIRWD
ncbi:hypothetical protein ACLOJK_011968 [Asimina triloba]